MERSVSPDDPSRLDLSRSGESDEQYLSDGDKQRLQHARTVFGLFAKAVKAIRLYGGKGPHVDRFRDDLHRELQQYLMAEGELKVDVAPDAFLMHGQAVLSVPADEGDDLIYELFREGLRELAFLPGLTPDELAVFLSLLVLDGAADERRLDDDRVTLIWEAGLEHVTVQVADLLTTGAYFHRNPVYRQHFAERLRRLVQRAAPTLRSSGPLARPERRAAPDRPAEAEVDARLEDFPGFVLRDALAPLEARDEARGLASFFDDDARRQPLRFLEVLCDAVATTSTPDERSFAVEHAVRLLEEALAAGDLDLLASAVTALRSHAQVRDATRASRQAFVGEVLAPLARYHRLILLRPVLVEGRPENLEKLMGFFDLLPRSELDALVSFLSKLGDGPAVKPLRELLERRGADLSPYYVARLKSENVLVVLESLRTLSASRGAGVDEAVRGLLDNRNPSVRRQALLSLKGRWSTQIFTDALRFLQSDEVGMRLAALDVIAAGHDPEMHAPLCTVVDRPEFVRRDSDERRQHLSALLACDRAGAVAWLQARMLRRNLFARRQQQALVEAAVPTLLEHDGPDTRQILAEWVSAEPPGSPLRQQVEAVLAARLAAEEEARQGTP